MLLGLLQDGKQDTATINCSFSQVYTRASKTLTTVTPKSTSKLRRTTHVGPLTHFPGEGVPNLIALRCLEALPLLMSSNDRVPIYFLTKQEVHVALHRCSAKNGKGKDKSDTSVSDQIVGLLTLPDCATLLKHPNLTESITSLVVLIGKPLTALAKKSEETKNQHASASTSAVPTGTLNEAGEALATSKKENSYNGSIYPTRPIYSISLELLSPSLILKHSSKWKKRPSDLPS
jgi:E3 ubiquitin-protein ligase HUWE1